MKISDKIISQINEMAFSRSLWVDRVRDSFLGGALGEYAKLKIARKLNKPDNWSDEVKTLLGKVSDYLDPKKIKSKSNFDRNKALAEAISEASTFQDQITSAKSSMANYYPKELRKIYNLKLKSEDLMSEMLKEFPID